MTDEKKIAQYNMEMVEHAVGAAQYLSALIGGRFVTREQARCLGKVSQAITHSLSTFP